MIQLFSSTLRPLLLTSHRITLVVLILTSISLSNSCTSRNLRGWWESSGDGKTYLVVEDDNGGGCGPIKLNGDLWPHRIGEKGEVFAGVHTISCGGSIGFEIKPETIFHFDYWGP